MREFLDRSTDLRALIRSAAKPNTNLAIFVHGFRGSYLGTWGNLPTYLANNVGNRTVFRKWDYLFLGYDTASIGNLLRIAELISSQWRAASLGYAPHRSRYKAFALVGHSLGTLGIRQLLCATSIQPERFTETLKSVALFGSPLNGSSLAPFARLAGLLDIAGGTISGVRAVVPSSYAIKEALRSDGPQIQMLRTWNNSIRKHVKLPEIHVYQGTSDWVVGPGEVNEDWIGDVKSLTTLTHSSLSKINEEWDNSPLLDALETALR